MPLSLLSQYISTYVSTSVFQALQEFAVGLHSNVELIPNEPDGWYTDYKESNSSILICYLFKATNVPVYKTSIDNLLYPAVIIEIPKNSGLLRMGTGFSTHRLNWPYIVNISTLSFTTYSSMPSLQSDASPIVGNHMNNATIWIVTMLMKLATLHMSSRNSLYYTTRLYTDGLITKRMLTSVLDQIKSDRVFESEMAGTHSFTGIHLIKILGNELTRLPTQSYMTKSRNLLGNLAANLIDDTPAAEYIINRGMTNFLIPNKYNQIIQSVMSESSDLGLIDYVMYDHLPLHYLLACEEGTAPLFNSFNATTYAGASANNSIPFVKLRSRANLRSTALFFDRTANPISPETIANEIIAYPIEIPEETVNEPDMSEQESSSQEVPDSTVDVSAMPELSPDYLRSIRLANLDAIFNDYTDDEEYYDSVIQYLDAPYRQSMPILQYLNPLYNVSGYYNTVVSHSLPPRHGFHTFDESPNTVGFNAQLVPEDRRFFFPGTIVYHTGHPMVIGLDFRTYQRFADTYTNLNPVNIQEYYRAIDNLEISTRHIHSAMTHLFAAYRYGTSGVTNNSRSYLLSELEALAIAMVMSKFGLYTGASTSSQRLEMISLLLRPIVEYHDIPEHDYEYNFDHLFTLINLYNRTVAVRGLDLLIMTTFNTRPVQALSTPFSHATPDEHPIQQSSFNNIPSPNSLLSYAQCRQMFSVLYAFNATIPEYMFNSYSPIQSIIYMKRAYSAYNYTIITMGFNLPIVTQIGGVNIGNVPSHECQLPRVAVLALHGSTYYHPLHHAFGAPLTRNQCIAVYEAATSSHVDNSNTTYAQVLALCEEHQYAVNNFNDDEITEMLCIELYNLSVITEHQDFPIINETPRYLGLAPRYFLDGSQIIQHNQTFRLDETAVDVVVDESVLTTTEDAEQVVPHAD